MNTRTCKLVNTVLFILTLFLCSNISRAADSINNYLGVRDDVLKSAAAATSEKYPDADAVTLSQTLKITYRIDGTWSQWHEGYIKILTKKGREDNLTISSYFTIPYQNKEDCRIDLVEIIKPDGNCKTINIAEQSNLSINTSGMESNIYDPNGKVITVNVSGLEVGDIIHYQMYDNTVLPYAKGIYEDAFSMEGSTPIEYMNILVEGPEDFPLQKMEVLDEIKNTVEFTENKADGNIVYNWIIKNVPQAIPEPNMPSMFTCTQRLLISTAPDWETVSRWYWELAEPALNATTVSMKAKVAELVKGAATPQEKIEKIFKFVSQDIRYMGITTETVSPGREPHPVNQTFEAKYGVCRDKAALLVSLLREAGIESYPVLIHNGNKKDIEVPSSSFNHAITAAKVDGEYILMDATDENTQRLLPAYLDNKSYLVATPEGDTLRTSPTIPATDNLLIIETSGSLSESGILQATSKMKFEGINDNLFRGYFSRITPDERKRLFESVISKVYGGGKITGFTILPVNLLDTSQPLCAEISYKTNNILAKDNGYALMPAPFISGTLGLANRIFYEAGLDKRRFPFIIGYTSGVKETVKISIDSGIKKIISMPVYSPVETDNITWRRSLAQVKSNIIGKNEFLIKSTEFSISDYLELKKAMSAIEYNSRKKPVLAVEQKTPEVAQQVKSFDVIVSTSKTYNILSKNSWEVIEETKKRILNYAGKKDNSEIIINYNPIWENAEIIEASVTSPDGKMQTISDKEINIMDQPWNGMAPRYPGGKTLVASLPSVDIGSVVEYKIRRTFKERLFFSMVELFNSFDPLSKNVKIFGADELNVQSMWNGPITQYDRENRVFSWSMSNTPIKKELFLPPSTSFLPTVAVSNGTWSDYSRHISELLLKACEKQEKTISLAKELTKDINDVIKKISVIRNYIYSNVRIAGPGFSELPLSSISPADITLNEGYGNTTDRAVLFYTMLKAIGENPKFYITTPYITAEGLKTPILENPQDGLLEKVLIKLEHGNVPIWLNDTTEYAQLGTTPSVGSIALNLMTGKFEEVRVYDTFMPEMDSYYSVDLKNNSDARIAVVKEFYGSYYENNNKLFSQMTPEEKNKFYQEELSTIAQSASAGGELQLDFSSYPGRLSYSANVPKFAVRDNEFLYFNLPKTLGRIFDLRSESRENPLFIGDYINKKIHILIALPDDFRVPVISPNNYKWNSPMYSGTIEVESILITPLALRTDSLGVPIGILRDDLIHILNESRNAIYITLTSKVKPALYPSALYPQVLDAQNMLFSPAAKEMMLKGEPKASAAAK